MTPDQILDRAADAIDRYGHTKGAFGNRRAGMCALGAMRHVVRRDNAYDTTDAALALMRAIRTRVPTWNDAPERTKDEVTSTMRACAATLRAQSAADTPVAAQTVPA